jgi:hypothetical protein
MGWPIISILATDPIRQETAMSRRVGFGFIVLIFAVIATPAMAQSNEQIDSILDEDVASVGSAAYIALSAAGLVNDDTSRDRAVAMAVEAGWLPDGTAASNPATFGQVAFLLMEAMDVRGGLMYRMIPGPRYAAREFTYNEWSPERRAPGDQISGEFLIRVTGNFLDKVEASR